MIRVVIDTNVVVSANLVDRGPSAAILDLAANKKIQMFVSPPVLAEYEEVLRRPRLKLAPARIAAALAVIVIGTDCDADATGGVRGCYHKSPCSGHIDGGHRVVGVHRDTRRLVK